jgi:hypothetical protein
MPVVLTAVLVLGMVAMVPMTASAVTIQEIVRLSKAGVSEQVILALIERDRTVFTIAPEQLVRLKDDGVSETVVVAMLRSGQQESSAASADTTQPEPGTGLVPESGPVVGVVGHGPDRPATAHADDFYGAAVPDVAPSVAPYPVPYLIPYPVLVPVNHAHREHAEHLERLDHREHHEVPVTPPPPTGIGKIGPGFVSIRGMFVDNPATGIFFANRATPAPAPASRPPAKEDCPQPAAKNPK